MIPGEGVGYEKFDFDAFGASVEERVKRLEEGIGYHQNVLDRVALFLPGQALPVPVSRSQSGLEKRIRMRANLARSAGCLLTLMVSAALVLLPHAAFAQQDPGAPQGKVFFTMYCTGCHGGGGKGNGPLGYLLSKKPADLTQISKKNHGKFPSQRVARVIDGRQGYLDVAGNIQPASHGPRDMPIWGDRLAELDKEGGGQAAVRKHIDQLIQYLKTIQEK
jgi:mono/diheme cytochrome c family protein